MKVKELIKKLQAFPEDTLVVTRWYEDWYDDISDTKIINIIKDNVDSEWNKKYHYFGLYSKASWADIQNRIEAIFIN